MRIFLCILFTSVVVFQMISMWVIAPLEDRVEELQEELAEKEKNTYSSEKGVRCVEWLKRVAPNETDEWFNCVFHASITVLAGQHDDQKNGIEYRDRIAIPTVVAWLKMLHHLRKGYRFHPQTRRKDEIEFLGIELLE